MRNYKDFRRKVLKNRRVREAYDDLGPEFAIIQMLIAKRLKRGITQKELAERIGTRQSAISRFESGAYNPTLSFLGRLANALDARISVSVK